jgi:hypothetical protein
MLLSSLRYSAGIFTFLKLLLLNIDVTSADVVESMCDCPGLPQLHQQPVDQRVFPGQTAYFSCWIDAIPQASITWLKDERPLHLDETRMLVLPSGKTIFCTM